MRDHGIDMADPTFDDEGAGEDVGTAAGRRARLRRVQRRRRGVQPGRGRPMIQVGPDGGSDAGVATEQQSSDG